MTDADGQSSTIWSRYTTLTKIISGLGACVGVVGYSVLLIFIKFFERGAVTHTDGSKSLVEINDMPAFVEISAGFAVGLPAAVTFFLVWLLLSLIRWLLVGKNPFTP